MGSKRAGTRVRQTGEMYVTGVPVTFDKAVLHVADDSNHFI